MNISIPNLSLVVLIGPSGSGKSTFAGKHFLPTEVLSSDACRCSQGAPQVICEEKHMGSRAVVIVCREEHVARERFGIAEGELGIIYTRTGSASSRNWS